MKRLLNRVRTLAVVCNQWGDSGKGKFVDLFADWAEIIARGTGADNAGHTVIVGERQHVLHLVPAGILHDPDGKVNIIGSGMAVNPAALLAELAQLEQAGLTHDHLMVALNARLTLPQHLLIEELKESRPGRIGTTRKGVGPVYTAHVARFGLIINDLLNRDVFATKLRRSLEDALGVIRQYDGQLVKKIMQQPQLGGGVFYSPTQIIDLDAVVECYCGYGQRLKHMICDTDAYVRSRQGEQNILLEGAQGLLLSIDRGTYPYVTSSDCSASGLAHGVGLKDRDLDLVLGVVKFPYMTRVGEGPFPTEMGGHASAKWCGRGEVNKQVEAEKYPNVSVNSADEFEQGVAVRQAGKEFGATTNRLRRCGWLDLPLLRYAVEQTGPDVILTKPDVLSGCETIKICIHYIFRGATLQYGERTIADGDLISTAIPHTEVLAQCQPVYQEFPGWCSNINDIRSLAALPASLRRILRFVEGQAGIKARVLSVGPDREQTIFV